MAVSGVFLVIIVGLVAYLTYRAPDVSNRAGC
jgi:hypothetical protein